MTEIFKDKCSIFVSDCTVAGLQWCIDYVGCAI